MPTFGMTTVIVVDADSKFRSVFEEMCSSMKITFWPLARGNLKGLAVKKYGQFLNKNSDHRRSNLTILQNAKTSQYVWNSAPIDNTSSPQK